MCIVKYDIAVCPRCSEKASNKNTYQKNSASKLYLNEREFNDEIEPCAESEDGRPCFPGAPDGLPVQQLWLCRRDRDNRDNRTIASCTLHTNFFRAKQSRNSELLKEERQKARKPPKIVRRGPGGCFQIQAGYEVLVALGINTKANLEYDDEKEREAAKETDKKYEGWKHAYKEYAKDWRL